MSTSEELDRLQRHPHVVRLLRSLAEHPPIIAELEGPVRRAAILLALRARADGEPELLMIKRAEAEGDPWSGHIACPGGRMEPGDHDLDAVRAGTVTDPLLQGALRVSGAIGELTGTWERAPRQVLARLHLLAARDLVAEDELGRPVNDPEVATRLDGLAGLVAAGPDDTPAVIVAAVVHGELLALRAFSGPNGVVARAAARLTLISRGLDPKGVSVPEAGHLARRPEYVGAATAYKTGTRDGVRAWLRHCCAAVELGAAEGVASCAAVASQ